jgi:hypothetical protein
MKKLRSSTFLNDFYRDLRDRRLLLPIAGLAVAIVAVPMLIGGGSEATAPPPPPAAASGEEAELAPAVLATDPGVRDYRERLATLKKTNPFVQKFSLPDPEQAALESVADASGSAESGSASVDSVSTGGGGASSDSSITDTVTDTTVSDGGGDVTTSTDTVTSSEDTTNDANHHKPPSTITRFYAGRIDVSVGPQGDAKRLDDVRILDFLPNEKNPVVAFLGLSHGADAAVFSVSRDVVKTEGEGSCSPKPPAGCEYLTLHEGEQRTLSFADGTTYRLRLLHTNVVAVPDPRSQQDANQADSTGG